MLAHRGRHPTRLKVPHGPPTRQACEPTRSGSPHEPPTPLACEPTRSSSPHEPPIPLACEPTRSSSPHEPPTPLACEPTRSSSPHEPPTRQAYEPTVDVRYTSTGLSSSRTAEHCNRVEVTSAPLLALILLNSFTSYSYLVPLYPTLDRSGPRYLTPAHILSMNSAPSLSLHLDQ
jgi:hypothetical protein